MEDRPLNNRMHAKVQEVKFLFLKKIPRKKGYKADKTHQVQFNMLSGFIYAKIEGVDFRGDTVKKLIPVLNDCIKFSKTLPHYEKRVLPKEVILKNIREFVKSFR